MKLISQYFLIFFILIAAINSGNSYASIIDPKKECKQEKPKKPQSDPPTFSIYENESDDQDNTSLEDDETDRLEVNEADSNASGKNSRDTYNEQDTDGDETVTSFNFIYYLIQKFKFSDILY